MKEINDALKACTFGKFHIKLLFIAFVGFVAGILASASTAYLLSNAECDLHMNLVQKGLLNAMPYIGELFSAKYFPDLYEAIEKKLCIPLQNFFG